ncbi:SAM-dependent methyltransferase [Actinomadura barringtoniae]|nr:SAM-dependent methyltransferase [Actinomadura barringtoniae]
MAHDSDGPTPDMPPSPDIDTGVPHSARIWNYWLGGKDNYPVDREVGEEFLSIFPGQVDIARAQRHFLARVVRFLGTEAGIRQFLDVGTGLPTVDNTHEVAQRVAPESRIVYVDNDPLVLAHARALLTSTSEGATDYIDADLHEPESILEAASATLDFSRPVALMLLGILGHVPGEDDPHGLLRRLLEQLAPGSYLVLADGTNVVNAERQNTDETARARAIQLYAASGGIPYHLRGPEEITAFFDGLELVEPGVLSVSWWRPEPSPFGKPREVDSYGGVARKP